MSFRHNFNSITSRLILLWAGLLFVGVLGRVFILSEFLREDLTELASAQLVTLSNYVAQDIDRDVVERRELLKRVAEKFPLPLLHNPQQLQRWLGEYHDVNQLFSFGMFVINPSGIALADYPVLPDRVGMSFADRDYFQQALRGEFAIGRPVTGRVSNVPVLPMAMPLRDSKGKVHAVLVGISALQSPNFMKALYATRIGATGGLLLISPRDQLFVGSSDASMILTPTPHEGVNKLHDRAMKGFRGFGMTVNARDVEELAAFTSVPSSGWFVVARLPTSEAFSPVTRLRGFVIKNTLFLLPFFLLVTIFGMRYMLRPLMNAARQADKMTRGEIPFEPLQVVRDDEVGYLTTAFNRVLSKLLASRTELQHIAHHDPLTGLPNRQLLADRMKQALARAQRSRGKVAVLFLDLDGFKPINDELGHEAGDAALREVTSRLSAVVRSEDTLARVGGDEFVILLSDLSDSAKDAAELVANKCLAAFQQPFVIHGQSNVLGTSIGDGECTADKLLIAADQAMYRAKQTGRGKFCWASKCTSCLETGQQSFCDVRSAHNKLHQQ
jgi:diguanylate cyclase (GGDEF)-like protein